MGILSLICFLSIFGGLTKGQQTFNQKATLYAQRGAQGQYVNIIEAYSPNLQVQSFDNRAYSVCVNGMWLFYDNQNYNTQARGQMEWFFGDSANPCIDYKIIPGKSSSVRFAGLAQDYRADSITLYAGTYFMNDQELITRDTATLTRAVETRSSSIIVTGTSAWTLYDNVKFTGNTICVYPGQNRNYEPKIIEDTQNIQVPHGTIRSVRKGCYQSRKKNGGSKFGSKSTINA